MARQIQTTVYKFEELSKAAKDRAKADFAAAEGNSGYTSAVDALASLEKLAEHFGGNLANYSIDFSGDYSPSFAEFVMPEMEPDEIKRRLDALGSFNPDTLKGDGESVLTGYCADEDAIDGFRIAYTRRGERDLGALMQAAFETWLEACQDDCRAYYEDENFAEVCEANNYEFYENGEML